VLLPQERMTTAQEGALRGPLGQGIRQRMGLHVPVALSAKLLASPVTSLIHWPNARLSIRVAASAPAPANSHTLRGMLRI
jgi:hypothetical protein